MHNMVQKTFSAMLVLGLTACTNGDMAQGPGGGTEIRVLTVGAHAHRNASASSAI